MTKIKRNFTLLAVFCISSVYAGTPSNLITNNAFDTDINGWSRAFGLAPTFTWVATDGNMAAGSLEIGDDGVNSSSTTTVSVTNCVSPVTPDVLTNIGVSFRVSAGTATPTCNIQVAESDLLNCANVSGVFNSGTSAGIASGSWSQATGSLIVGINTVSLFTRMHCTNPSGDSTDFTIRFDDPFIIQPTTPVDLQSFSVD